MDSCVVCGSTGELKRCAKCKVVKYCGREHQVQHWTTHKITCGKKKAADASSSGEPVRTDLVAQASPGSASVEAASAGPKSTEEDPAIPFDTRPTKLVEFDKPVSRDPKDILQLCFDGLSANGYAVIDDVLEEEEYKKIEMEIKLLEESGRMKEGRLEGRRYTYTYLSQLAVKVFDGNTKFFFVIY